jgi:hypothetical protein
MRSRRLFGAGLFFFVIGIVISNPAIMGFALVLLFYALVNKKREPNSFDETNTAA